MLVLVLGPDCFLSIFSGMDVLQYNEVSYEMLASCFPESLSPFLEFSQRLKIEGDYIFTSTDSIVFLLYSSQL